MSDATEAAMMKEPGIVLCLELVRPHEELEDELLHVDGNAVHLYRVDGDSSCGID
jgi:hypothetical protein